MGRYAGIPELLEQFMDESEADEQWITVHDLRDRFSLTRYHCNTVSGFLRRLNFGTVGRYQFIVVKIERCRVIIHQILKTAVTWSDARTGYHKRTV
jgi:hypothetical protein